MNLDSTQRSKLLTLARQSIDSGLTAMRWVAMPPMELHPLLTEVRGSFVTLRTGKQLRGGSGNLATDRPVGEDVWHHAWAAAFADPRFAPLDLDEWSEITIQISIASPLERLIIDSEAELLRRLRPGVDGLLLERGMARATFLPEVWEHIDDPEAFVRHLKEKAGWPADAWSPYIEAYRYTTEDFREDGALDAQRNLRRSTAA